MITAAATIPACSSCSRLFVGSVPEVCRNCGTMVCRRCYMSHGGFCTRGCYLHFSNDLFDSILSKYGLPKSALPALLEAAELSRNAILQESDLESQ